MPWTREQKKSWRKAYNEMLHSLSKGDVRTRYQVLCANCHCIKTHSNGEWKQREHEPMAMPLLDWIKEAPG